MTHKVPLKVYIERDKTLQIYFKKLILTKKVKNYKSKKLWKMFKPYQQMEKNNHNIWWYWNQKTKILSI